MSAPTSAVLLAGYVGQMLVDLAKEIGRDPTTGLVSEVRVRIEHSVHTTSPFHCYIEEGLATYHGDGDDAGHALMMANGSRQRSQEMRARQRLVR